MRRIAKPEFAATRVSRTSSIATRLIISLTVVLAALVGVANSASATTYANYHTTTDVSARSTAAAAPTSVYGAPSGATIAVQCQAIGQPVGPYGNTLYFWILYAGRNFYVPDTYTDSPHLAGQPPIAGIPLCGTTTPPPSTDPPAVWVGMPFNGAWPDTQGCTASTVFPTPYCSLPSVHRSDYSGDWAMDIQGVAARTPVVVYAAPKNTALNNSITAQVATVRTACANGVIAYGGYEVVVNFYYGSQLIGHATYAHVNPSVSQGQTISRWGSQIGVVGSYTSNGCWTGVHTHFELYNASHYACYRPGVTPAARLNATNYIGYLGGSYASGPHQACPAGI
jgi:hypothetical protein